MLKSNYFFWHCWTVLLTSSVTSASYNCRSPPNIVFMMADDMGWSDVSYQGSQIRTPNIDAMASKSVVFQQYYSEAICTPARSALLTGKYPMRIGMQGSPLFNSENRGIPLSERLLPSYFKDLGYSTHLVGKWHVGMSQVEYLPTLRGYDSHFGMHGGFVDYYTYNKVETWPNGRLLFGLDLFDNQIPQETEERYIVDALTDRAVEIIHYHNTSQPLFLHLTHNAPHAGNEGGLLQPPLYSQVRNQHIANPDRRLYAEIVTHLDRSIGRVVSALAYKGILDNTIIVFVSDNGAPTVGQFSNWGVNLPFRGRKETPWEGAVRVPAFIWHSSLEPKVWDGLMHISDWLPTLLTAAGANSNGLQIDGVNQWDSIVRNEPSNRKEVLIVAEDVYAAYRAGDYKIILGNVTGLNNDYYGASFLINKAPPPPYFPTLRSSEVIRAFESIGIYVADEEVQALRETVAIKQVDTVMDATPCVPTPTRGCLFNIRQDPSERHDLWQNSSRIVTLLTNRLRTLLSMQMRRGPRDLDSEADPANFNYIWTPWIDGATGLPISPLINNTDISKNQKKAGNWQLNAKYNNKNNIRNERTAIDCSGTSGFQNFICFLQRYL